MRSAAACLSLLFYARFSTAVLLLLFSAVAAGYMSFLPKKYHPRAEPVFAVSTFTRPASTALWFVKTESFIASKPFAEIAPSLEAHKAWVAALRGQGRRITSGYRADAEGKPGGGGLMIFEAADHEAAEALVLQDPLVANGCTEWQLNRWVADVGDLELVDGGAWYERSKSAATEGV